MTLQDVTHRLITDRIAQVLYSSLNAIIAPRTVFPRYAVGSKNSCGLTMVVLEEPTEPFPALDRAITLAALAWDRKEHDITLALVWPLFMIVDHVFCEGSVLKVEMAIFTLPVQQPIGSQTSQ